jgi:photosynthetic reaction center H subunit
MHTGAITSYIDVAQLALYAFWVFFACLIVYLRREDKREGYPLESERSGRIRIQGWPGIPSPKTFLLRDGGIRVAPRPDAPKAAINAAPSGDWPGAPLEPTGPNPMLAGVGPGAYADRPDVPDRTVDGQVKIVPLRLAPGYAIEHRDPDPRGMDVVGADRMLGGVVRDVWVDQSEALIRFLEVEVTDAAGAKRVLLPINFTRIRGDRRQVKVKSILGAHFADVPATKSPDQVTLLEEERIMAYYGAGHLYAKPSRMGPIL